MGRRRKLEAWLLRSTPLSGDVPGVLPLNATIRGDAVMRPVLA